MYIILGFPSIIPNLLLLPILASLLFDNLLRLKQEKNYGPIAAFAAWSLGGIFVFSWLTLFLSLGILAILESAELDFADSIYFAMGVILPVLPIPVIFWLMRNKIETKPIAKKDFLAALIHIGFLASMLVIGDYYIFKPASTLITILFPGLVGLWLTTKVSPHTWKFFLAQVLTSLFSLFIFGIIFLLFSSQ